MNRPRNGAKSTPRHSNCLWWCKRHFVQKWRSSWSACSMLLLKAMMYHARVYIYVNPDTYQEKRWPEVFDHSCSLVTGFLESPWFSPYHLRNKGHFSLSSHSFYGWLSVITCWLSDNKFRCRWVQLKGSQSERSFSFWGGISSVLKLDLVFINRTAGCSPHGCAAQPMKLYAWWGL